MKTVERTAIADFNVIGCVNSEEVRWLYWCCIDVLRPFNTFQVISGGVS